MKSEHSATADQSRPAAELLARLLELNDETTKVHGGQWTYSNDARSAWDGTKTSGYVAYTCTRLKPGSGEKRAYRYSSMIMGPAVEDPEAAVEKYVSHFEQQGFTETTKVHGGQWTYSNDARSAWDGTKTSGYVAYTCTRLKPGSGEKRAYRYSSMIMGPAVEDPETAVEKYVSHFEQQGFTETNRYDSEVPKSLRPGYYIMVTLQDDEGSTLVYQAGTHLSSLSYEGPCSYDPAMEFRTT